MFCRSNKQPLKPHPAHMCWIYYRFSSFFGQLPSKWWLANPGGFHLTATPPGTQDYQTLKQGMSEFTHALKCWKLDMTHITSISRSLTLCMATNELWGRLGSFPVCPGTRGKISMTPLLNFYIFPLSLTFFRTSSLDTKPWWSQMSYLFCWYLYAHSWAVSSLNKLEAEKGEDWIVNVI